MLAPNWTAEAIEPPRISSKKKAASEENDPLNKDNPVLRKIVSLKLEIETIFQNIFCITVVKSMSRQIRIFEQQPTDMAPEKASLRTVRIRSVIGVFVMTSVNRNPPCWRILYTTNRDNNKRVLEPFWAHEASMGKQPMVPNVDS